jgi:hypothetical protein
LIKKQKETILESVKKNSPQFIFWHLFTVHPPYIYDEEGSCRETSRSGRRNWRGRKELYLSHIKHTNNLLIETFDKAREQSSRPIIFVIQSDEGPFPMQYLKEEKDYVFLDKNDRELQFKFGIFNAVYFPSKSYKGFEKEITPINSFRHILNEIFQKKTPLLKHRSYCFNTEKYPYDLTDITNRLELPDGH